MNENTQFFVQYNNVCKRVVLYLTTSSISYHHKHKIKYTVQQNMNFFISMYITQFTQTKQNNQTDTHTHVAFAYLIMSLSSRVLCRFDFVFEIKDM